MTAAPQDIALAFLRAFWDGDDAAAAQLCTPDAEWHFPPALDYPSPMPAAEAVALVNRDMLDLFEPDSRFSIDIHSVIAEGHSVAVEYAATGRTRAGRDYHNRYVMRIDVEGDKVSSVRPYTDTLHLTNVLFGDPPAAEQTPR